MSATELALRHGRALLFLAVAAAVWEHAEGVAAGVRTMNAAIAAATTPSPLEGEGVVNPSPRAPGRALRPPAGGA